MTDLRTMQVYGFVFYFVLVCLLACFWFGLVFFSDEYGKMWHFRLEKQLNTKQSSVSHPSRSLEVISTGAYLTVEAGQGFAEGSRVSHWARDYSCDTSAKNLAALCSHPEHLPEAE